MIIVYKYLAKAFVSDTRTSCVVVARRSLQLFRDAAAGTTPRGTAGGHMARRRRSLDTRRVLLPCRNVTLRYYLFSLQEKTDDRCGSDYCCNGDAFIHDCFGFIISHVCFLIFEDTVVLLPQEHRLDAFPFWPPNSFRAPSSTHQMRLLPCSGKPDCPDVSPGKYLFLQCRKSSHGVLAAAPGACITQCR